MHQNLMPTYAPPPITFVRGEGTYLYTDTGERYLDCIAGVAVNTLGHCHPRLVEALDEQSRALWHVSNLLAHEGQGRLAALLAASTFADHVFFCNSGLEAWECSIKAVRRYHHANGRPERWRVITFTNAFHGRGFMGIAAANQQRLLEGFGPKCEGFDQIAVGDLEALRAAIGPETAAICIEPIQGDGGLVPVPLDFMRQLRAIADEHGLLLMLDEIQTGVGRTGKLFAYEWAGIVPDVMSIAKGIGGGFPLGACLATEAVGQCMDLGRHGSTFGGNLLATAVGYAVLEAVLTPGFLEQVDSVGETLRAGLSDIAERHPDTFVDVRGRGLMIGVQCHSDILNGDIVAALRDRHILCPPASQNVVRLLPPLILEQSHVEQILDAFDHVATVVEQRIVA